MDAHATAATFGDACLDFIGRFPLPDVTAAPSLPPYPSLQLFIPQRDFGSMSPPKSDVGYSGGNCATYGSTSSLSSYSTQPPGSMQRSVSSHSLRKRGVGCQPVWSPTEFVDLESSPVRKAFSAGDLQLMNVGQHYHRSESPLSNENSSIIDSMNRACRYSPEEKKERIERYKSKRNQRNFNKKIKYACRKTLADSRPRIRGRFARNDEIEKCSPDQWSHIAEEEDDDDDYNWINFIDAFSSNLLP